MGQALGLAAEELAKGPMASRRDCILWGLSQSRMFARKRKAPWQGRPGLTLQGV